MAETNRDRERRRTHLLEAANHVLQGEPVDAIGGVGEVLVCSCGWTSPTEVCWHDDVVVSELRAWDHAEMYVLIYSPGHEMCTGGIVLVEGKRRKRVPGRDLAWLITQTQLPETLRVAAKQELADR